MVNPLPNVLQAYVDLLRLAPDVGLKHKPIACSHKCYLSLTHKSKDLGADERIILKSILIASAVRVVTKSNVHHRVHNSPVLVSNCNIWIRSILSDPYSLTLYFHLHYVLKWTLSVLCLKFSSQFLPAPPCHVFCPSHSLCISAHARIIS
jgi:hypothetical protein